MARSNGTTLRRASAIARNNDSRVRFEMIALLTSSNKRYPAALFSASILLLTQTHIRVLVAILTFRVMAVNNGWRAFLISTTSPASHIVEPDECSRRVRVTLSTTVSRSALRRDGARTQLGREQGEERLPGRRELTCAAIHDADRAAEGTFDGRSGHQGARADFGNERRRRQERQAEAGLNGALDRLDIVELHGVANPHPVTAQEAVDQAAGGNVAVEADERLAVENGERTAGAPRDGVVGRCRDDELVIAERHDCELRPARWQRHEAEIDVTIEARGVHLVGAPVRGAHV